VARPIHATVSAAALRHNYVTAQRAAPHARAYAVVKANAYGHGLGRVARALGDAADGYALVELEGAVALREMYAGPILLLEGFFQSNELRLIDQQVIRQTIASGEYPRASESDAAQLLSRIRTSRFGGSDARLTAELNRYGLTKAQLQEHLLWQLTVLRFIDERFRPGVQVADNDIRKYYDDHLAELKRQNPRDSSFEALEPKIRETLEGEGINKQFDEWLTAARGRTWIEFHERHTK